MTAAVDAHLKKAAAESARLAADLGAGIDALRVRIAELRDEASIVAGAEVDEAEALRRVDLVVDRLTRPREVGAMLAVPLPGDFASPMFEQAAPHRPDLGAMLGFYLSGDLRAAMKKEVRAFYAGGRGEAPTLTDGERREQLDDLDQRVLDLEMAEEAMIRGAAKIGLTIARRGDADPRAVLAHDADLKMGA